MATLRVSEDAATGQVVMRSAVLPRLGGLMTPLIWLAFIAFFFFASDSRGIDWANALIFLLFFLLSTGAGLLTAILGTKIVVDPSTRTLTESRDLLGLPVFSRVVPFTDLQHIEYEYYRQSSGRSAHDAWRVSAVTRDATKIALNWDGKKDEMASLANRIAKITRTDLVDKSDKPASSVQSVETMNDRLDGEEPEERPRPLDQMPAPSIPTGEWTLPTLETAPVEIPTAVPASDVRRLSIAALEQRLQNDPDDPEARYWLARRYHAHGEIDRAIAAYLQVLKRDPTNANAQNDLGVAFQQRGQRAEAEAAYRRAAALDPFFTTAHLNLGMLLRSTNRASEASQAFFQARQNARGDAERELAEKASTGSKLEPQLSKM